MVESFFEVLPYLADAGFDRQTRTLFLSGEKVEEARELLIFLSESNLSQWSFKMTIVPRTIFPQPVFF